VSNYNNLETLRDAIIKENPVKSGFLQITFVVNWGWVQSHK
jgi:hypothetical protein